MRATKFAAWVLGAVFLAPFVMLGDFWWRSRRHVAGLCPDPVSGWTLLWLAAAGAVSVALLANPRRAWWRFSAWRFKNPEAIEPSDALYAVLRLAGFVGAVVVAVALVEQCLNERAHEEWEVRQHRTASGQRTADPSRHRPPARGWSLDLAEPEARAPGPVVL